MLCVYLPASLGPLPAAQFEGVPGTQVTVMSINDIKLPAGMYKFVNQVLRRYPGQAPGAGTVCVLVVSR